MVLIALTDVVKRERAWFRRQKGYLRAEVARDVSRLEARIADLEAMLGRRHYPADEK